MGRSVNESIARKLKSEYLAKLSSIQKEAADGSEAVAVTTLPTKTQGRPLMFGKLLDSAVQNLIMGLRRNRAVINTRIVMAVGEGVLKARDPSKLDVHGGPVQITKGWAKSLMKRMGFSKRKGTNAGKIAVSDFEERKECFLADITAEVMMNEIPDELIINWDQTPLHIVPTGDWTMHKSGEKIIPIANLDDKRQITAVVAVTIGGHYLAPQLIYQGKPFVLIPRLHHLMNGISGNHWSNEETMQRYIQKVILPYVSSQRKELKLSETHPALVLFDVFKGQTTPNIKKLLEDNHVSMVLVPPNCTDKLQPLDISINKPMKDALKDQFQSW